MNVGYKMQGLPIVPAEQPCNALPRTHTHARTHTHEVLTASVSPLSLEAWLLTTTDSSTATQRCLSGKLGAMK